MLMILIGLALAVGALVVGVEGLSPFTIWNLLPVILVLVTAILAERTVPRREWIRAITASAGVVALTVVTLAHLAWHFDWSGTATGSSTSGLIFLVTPVWAVGTAAVLAGAGLVAWAVLGRRGRAAQQAIGPVGQRAGTLGRAARSSIATFGAKGET